MGEWAVAEVLRRGPVATGNTVEIPTTLWNHIYGDYANHMFDADAEATGRAAVRLLQRAMDAIHEGRPREVDCGYVFCDEATAVLVTDTATAWLNQQEEGND